VSSAAISDDGLPLVGEDKGNRGLWLGLGGIALGGVLLFAILEGNRQSSAEPIIPNPRDYAVATAPQPGLLIPASTSLGPYSYDPVEQANAGVSALPPAPQRLPPARLTITPPSNAGPRQSLPDTPAPYVSSAPPIVPAAPDPGRSAPVIVYDAVVAAVAAAAGSDPASQTTRAAPAIAATGVDRSNLVAQGTLIYAVLETALNSTQAGQVRALISNNVYNAAGTKILIPKGSRVFGEYKADLAAGQNRAQVIWGRLIRPDGATISLDSPASDQLGRAGIKGRVDTHFGERLLNALLQSTIDFGTAVASRAVTDNSGVVIALPNVTQGGTSQVLREVPKPTLKVRHGTRIAVFVSRDLDFSAVE
jgi:type IV secretion system protein VirB10